MTNIERLKKHFGTTSNILESGFILTDGSILDLSEKNNGGSAGMRNADHRDINFIYPNKGNTESLIHFMNIGNIRLVPETKGIDLVTMPNELQFKILRQYINYFNGEIILDISDKKGINISSKEYKIHTSSSRIINDIKEYFTRK